MASLERELARAVAELRRAQWRMSRIMRPAVVDAYDKDTHTARARLNPQSSKGGMSPAKTRIMEAAGTPTSRTTLTKGQTCWLFCPNGDMRQAQIIAGSFSNTFKSPSNAEVEDRRQVEDTFVSLTPGLAVIEAETIVLRGNVFLGDEGGARVLTVAGHAEKAWAV